MAGSAYRPQRRHARMSTQPHKEDIQDSSARNNQKPIFICQRIIRFRSAIIITRTRRHAGEWTAPEGGMGMSGNARVVYRGRGASRASGSQFQSVSYFTVTSRAHPSTGSQSGSAAPDLTQVPSTRSRGLLKWDECRISTVASA